MSLSYFVPTMEEEFEDEFGGYDFEFLHELSECQKCSICLLAMRDPVQTECGHRFCETCLMRSFRWSTMCSMYWTSMEKAVKILKHRRYNCVPFQPDKSSKKETKTNWIISPANKYTQLSRSDTNTDAKCINRVSNFWFLFFSVKAIKFVHKIENLFLTER